MSTGVAFLMAVMVLTRTADWGDSKLVFRTGGTVMFPLPALTGSPPTCLDAGILDRMQEERKSTLFTKSSTVFTSTMLSPKLAFKQLSSLVWFAPDNASSPLPTMHNRNNLSLNTVKASVTRVSLDMSCSLKPSPMITFTDSDSSLKEDNKSKGVEGIFTIPSTSEATASSWSTEHSPNST